jgi:Predicted transcriptional regulators
MKWKFRGDRPIYAQLIEQLERGILTGEYPPGSAVPSVRTLAIEAEVNPNTMQKALAELESRELMHTHRTSGRTVTEDKAMIDSLKEELARAQIIEFFEGMKSIGIEKQNAIKLIQDAVKEIGTEPNTEVM